MKGMAQALNLKPYPAYKDSGIPGAGSIPPNWEAERLKGHVENVVNPTRQREPEETYIALEHVESWTGKIRDAGDDVNFESQVKRFQKRDVLFGKLRPYLAKVTAPNRSGVCAGEFLVLRPLGHHLATKFLERFLRSKPIIDAVDASTFGAKMPRADWSFIGNMEMPVPPPDEQTAIVRFLDHADEQTQRYIASKERLIALLEEERQALVHQAVTGGLDHNVRLKPSGVEWVGDVPEHWETVRLGSIGRFSKGNGGTKEDEVPAGVPCIRYGDIYTSHKYFINASRAYIKPEKTSEYTPLRFGDILFAGSGETIEEIGKSAVNLIDGPAYSGGDVIIFRPTIRLNAEFTGYATDAPATQAQKSIMGRGFTVMHIYGNQLKNIQIALPPIGEQDGIVEHINNGTALIDDTIARSHRQINLMNEYRTRLIADVVTGQLDVREAAAKLPAESLENKLPNEVVPA